MFSNPPLWRFSPQGVTRARQSKKSDKHGGVYVKMVTTKRCAWGTCSNDSRLPHRLKRNSNGDEIFFLHFPGVKSHKEKRERWIRACHRGDRFVCTKHSYICSLHFVGENGPSPVHPDPVSAIASREKVNLILDNAYQTQQATTPVRFVNIFISICLHNHRTIAS